ncbi:MAG: metal-dependent transcriptional regulator [Clostridia bacterium]|nr:metal-dependent transcriptional regulator [Christensenellaceae bacterium]MBR6239259.1 metal-dependent transcriptional regulator [Clostridia bacterium]
MQESGEMYLENILILEKKIKNTRSIDIAQQMNYSKPSVSRAVSILKKDGCIDISPEGYISLTKKGRDIAEKIYERHNILTEILLDLGVDSENAVNDACRIEHVISDESFAAIKKYINNKQRTV